MSNFQRPRSWFQCFQAYDTSHRLDNSLLQITLNITLRFQHSPCVWIGHIIRVHCWLICVSCFSVIGRVTLYFRDRWPAPRFATCNVFASQYKTCNLNQQILFLRRTCTFHLIAVQNVFVLILIFRASANFVFTLIEIRSEPTRINLHVFFLLSQFCCRERKIEGCPCSENLLFHWIPPRLQGEHCGSIFWTLKKNFHSLRGVTAPSTNPRHTLTMSGEKWVDEFDAFPPFLTFCFPDIPGEDGHTRNSSTTSQTGSAGYSSSQSSHGTTAQVSRLSWHF